ncbi:MAG: hypothetical protein QOC92_4859, partial [Acidimicrobiaceae bacterium]
SGSEDAYVAKLAPDGKSVSYLTYLVGNDVDEVTGVAVNSGGDAFAAGWTASTDFPSTTNVGANPSSGKDVFVVRLGPGGAPAWATEFGGGGDDEAHGITINDAGAPVVVGSTDGPPPSTASFPTAGTGADTIVNGGIDGFATMLEADGSAITMSTLIGGSGDDDARAVVTIGAFPHVAGTTNSTDFPLQNEYQASLAAAGNDMFYASFALTGARVDSTYIGGTGTDSGTGIAVGRANASAGWGYDVWVTGQTDSATVLGQTGFHGGVSDGLAVRLGTPSPTVLFVGGTDSDSITGATSDNAGNLIIGGMTGSNPLQIGATSISTLNGTDTGSNGGLDGYVAKIRGDAGYAPAWGTYLGGSDMEWVWAVATDEGSGIYAAGFTFSSDFPASADALQAQRNNWSFDGFATKWAFAPVVVTGPTGYQTTNSATFQFSSDEPGVSFHCRLAPTLGEHNCANSRTFNNLADGTYTFGVYATDTTGTRDPFVERRFTVDTTAPAEFALREPAEGAQTGTTPTFTWDPAADANGIASYRLEIDGTAQTVDVTACGSGRCQAPSATALKTGARSWRVVAIDTVGNERASATRNFIAQAPPTARFTSAPNPALVGHAVTFDGSPSADGSHTVARYEWDLDGDGSYETDGGASATASRSYATVQTLQIGLRITDSTGLTAEAHNELRVTTQTIVGQFGVSINEGAQYSRTPDVTVTANFPSAITDMLFSNDGGFFAPTRFAPAKLTTWTLDSSGPERLPKIVYIRFLTGPLTSETHTDDIILDETPPKVDSAAIAGPPKAAASAAKKRRYVLKLKASDSNSGVAGIQVTANKRTPGKLLRYKRKLTVKATARPRWVRARDRAGNLSGWRKVR